MLLNAGPRSEILFSVFVYSLRQECGQECCALREHGAQLLIRSVMHHAHCVFVEVVGGYRNKGAVSTRMKSLSRSRGDGAAGFL